MFSSFDELSSRPITIFTTNLLYKQETIDKIWLGFELAFQ